MNNTYEIKFSLLLLVSLFLHVILFVSIILPNYSNLNYTRDIFESTAWGGRDVIVNINQDNRKNYNYKTLLSDKDSTARGFLTRKRGDRWLNNSLDFYLYKGNPGVSRNGRKYPAKVKNIILNNDSEIVVSIQKYEPDRGTAGQKGWRNRILIPDKNDITMENAIYYSNSGLFSFNTAKFKNFKYFKDMKDKIASNWILPGMANIAFGSYNPVTGSFSTARGWERYMAIPSQRVKIYFTMNRKGRVLSVHLIDSMGNRYLDTSCIEAIKLSKSFGRVPDEIRGNVIGIPFIFGYYVR